jgi:hypothetical protein
VAVPSGRTRDAPHPPGLRHQAAPGPRHYRVLGRTVARVGARADEEHGGPPDPPRLRVQERTGRHSRQRERARPRTAGRRRASPRRTLSSVDSRKGCKGEAAPAPGLRGHGPRHARRQPAIVRGDPIPRRRRAGIGPKEEREGIRPQDGRARAASRAWLSHQRSRRRRAGQSGRPRSTGRGAF